MLHECGRYRSRTVPSGCNPRIGPLLPKLHHYPIPGFVAFGAGNQIEFILVLSHDGLPYKAMRFFYLAARGLRKVILTPKESFLIIRMAVWVSVLSALVKFRPLPRALQIVAARPKGRSAEPPEETMARLARAIDQLLRADLFVFKPICWKRAAVLHRYLTLSGINSRIVFGVRRGPKGEVDGHAWLESDGMPILESTAPNYKVTYAFPSNDPFEADLASMSSQS